MSNVIHSIQKADAAARICGNCVYYCTVHKWTNAIGLCAAWNPKESPRFYETCDEFVTNEILSHKQFSKSYNIGYYKPSTEQGTFEMLDVGVAFLVGCIIGYFSFGSTAGMLALGLVLAVVVMVANDE